MVPRAGPLLRSTRWAGPEGDESQGRNATPIWSPQSLDGVFGHFAGALKLSFFTSGIGSWFLSSTKKEFRATDSSTRRTLISKQSKSTLKKEELSQLLREPPWPFRKKVTEVEVSQLGCVDSGNELQRQKEGPCRQVQGVSPGWATAACCSPGCKSCGDT